MLGLRNFTLNYLRISHFTRLESEATIDIMTRNGMRFYLVTIAAHCKTRKVHYYEVVDIITLLKLTHGSFHVINSVFEYGDRYSQLHAHLVVSSKYMLRYRSLNTFNGFRINYKPLGTVEDLHRVQMYIAKDCYDTFKFT